MKENKKETTVFLDPNILISGLFFAGNESKLLSLGGIKFVITEIIKELKKVVLKKFCFEDVEESRIIINGLKNAIVNFEVIKESEYCGYISEAKKYMATKEDAKILTAVFAREPDFFMTSDKNFYKENIKQIVPLNIQKIY